MRPGPRFRKLRDGLGLSLEAVGMKIGLSRQSVQQFEAVGSNPSFNKIETFVSAIGITVAEFFESKIPNDYADAEHAELHSRLQEILDSSDKSKIECITTVVETFYDTAMKSEIKKPLKEKKTGTA